MEALRFGCGIQVCFIMKSMVKIVNDELNYLGVHNPLYACDVII